jgi:hypothetical protein
MIFSNYLCAKYWSVQPWQKIPKGAQVIFLPENDRELSRANLWLAQTVRKQGGKVALIKITLVPQVVTVCTPRLEFAQVA